MIESRERKTRLAAICKRRVTLRRYRSLTEPYLDSCGIFKEDISAILGTVAKQERLRISERVSAGLRHARLTGTRSGRPIGRPRLVFDRAKAVQLRLEGVSWRQIARRLGVSVASARRAYRAFGTCILDREQKQSPLAKAAQSL